MDDGDREISTKKPYRTFSTAPVGLVQRYYSPRAILRTGRAGAAAWS